MASSKVLYNAGLLARDHRPMTVANIYAAVEAMLGAQHVHSERVLWLADVLRRINDHPASRLHKLLPWNWRKPAQSTAQAV